MKCLIILWLTVIIIICNPIKSIEDRRCSSSTWDDRKSEESLNAFKAKCSSWNSEKYSNGYAAYMTGCGYDNTNVSCCCSLKLWPTKSEDLLLDDEKNLPEKSKNLLGNVKLYLANLSNKVQISNFSQTIQKLMVGDVASIVGSSLAAGNLSFLALDKMKENFIAPMQKTFSKYLGEIGKTDLFETLSKTKGFSFGAKVLDKVGFVYGVAIPVLTTQIEDFKSKLPLRYHISDLISEGSIAFSTVYASTEAGAAIGATFFGGGAIPGAVAGFTVGVVIQLVTDGMIKVDGNTPADYIRIGVDKLFMIDESSKIFQDSQKLLEIE